MCAMIKPRSDIELRGKVPTYRANNRFSVVISIVVTSLNNASAR